VKATDYLHKETMSERVAAMEIAKYIMKKEKLILLAIEQELSTRSDKDWCCGILILVHNIVQ
jgi:hypothetical protein